MSRAGAWTKMKKGGHDDDKYDSKEVSEDLYLLTLVAVAGDAFKASSVLRKIVTFL